MIKRIVPFALLGLTLVGLNACKNGNSGYKKTPGGVEYKIVKDAPGDKKLSIGDQLQLHITVRLLYSNGKDTVLFSSRQMNNNQPVPYSLDLPKYHGDAAEAFAMLTPGDSAVLHVPTDSLQKAGGQLPSFMKPGQTLEYDVVVVSAKSKADVMNEMQQHTAQQKEIDDKLLQDYFAKNNIKAEKTASGLYYKINTPGSGDNIKPGQSVTVNYTGKTMDGKAFDSNVDPEFKHVEPFKLVIGQGQVIRGWDEGITLLKKGSKATLYIPSTLAYGPQGNPPVIPANAVLMFDVEIVDAK